MNYRNYVELEGFLGNDAEQKFTTTGKSLTTLSLAVKQSWQKDGQWDSHTDWFKVVAWNGASKTSANFKKGAHVRVEGQLRTDSYNGQNGKVRTLEIVAFTIEETPREEKRGTAPEAAAASSSEPELPFNLPASVPAAPPAEPETASITPAPEEAPAAPKRRKRSRKSTTGEAA